MAWRSPRRGNDQSLAARSKQRRALAQRGRLADLSRVYDYGQPRNYHIPDQLCVLLSNSEGDSVCS